MVGRNSGDVRKGNIALFWGKPLVEHWLMNCAGGSGRERTVCALCVCVTCDTVIVPVPKIEDK